MKVNTRIPSFAQTHFKTVKDPLDTEALASAESELRGQDFKPGELIIGLTSNAKPLEDYQLETLETFSFSGDSPSREGSETIARVKLPDGVSVAEGLAALRQSGQVRFAEPNSVLTLDAPKLERTFTEGQLSSTAQDVPEDAADRGKVPNDLDFRMWAPYNNGRRGGKAGADISAPEAWEKTVGSGEPLIAVIDTGIDYNHPDLADNMWMNPGEIPGDGLDNDGNGVIDDVYGYNAYADNGEPLDDHSHGTHCAGTIGAVGNNGLGVTGVNWRANMMAIKIFNKTGQTSIDAILRGLQYAARMDVDITNNSWGDFRPSTALKEAFASMPEAVHFAAAGNDRNNNDQRNYYPVGHDLPNMVGVAASDRRDQKPSFSNYGQNTVELTAPGDQILSTVINGSYGIYSGTSMASPHAAGVAGLILSEFGDLSPEQVRDRLLYNSDRMPSLRVTSQSGGRINASKSLEEDTVPPSSPLDFRAAKADSKSVKLSWTTPGDDGWCGGAPAAVELWVSDKPIKPENLHEAELLRTALPEKVGELVEYDYPTGHSDEDRTFHFAFRAVDNVGSRSSLMTTSARVPASKELYSNTFGPDDGFTGEDRWDRVLESGNWVWTDSPEGNYRSGANTSLVSPSISLEGYQNCQLSLDAKHDLWRVDKGVLEVSSGQDEWKSLGTFHGKRSKWGERTFDLSAFDGQEVRVRVRLESDTRVNKDGIYIDNFRIVGDKV